MKYIDSAMLHRPVEVGMCIHERDYLRETRRLKVANPNSFVNQGKVATVHWFDNTNGGEDIALVCIDLAKVSDCDGIQIAAVLVHEAVHVFQFICEHWGETTPSVEFEAYSIQRLSQQLMYLFCELTVEKSAA